MKLDRKAMRLYAVTDRAWTGKLSLYQQVEAALKGGVTCVQLREKDLDPRDFLAEAVRLAELCRAWEVPFLINDNVDIALKCGADGVHVGQEDMAPEAARRLLGPDKIVGVSAHTPEEARRAVAGGADYLGAGAVFPTTTKSGVTGLKKETLQEICRVAGVPVVAIGGISRTNLLQLAGSGVDGVAVVSAIFAAEDPQAAAAELRALSEEMVNAHG